MTYLEFRDKYNGKLIDYDKNYGGQCWDLAQQYFVECLEVPEYVLAGCGVISNMLIEPKINDLLTYFDEVSMTDMKQGDIVIWTYGHIAILDNWDGTNNWYFTQNPGEAHIGLCGNGQSRAFRRKIKKDSELYYKKLYEEEVNKNLILQSKIDKAINDLTK